MGNIVHVRLFSNRNIIFQVAFTLNQLSFILLFVALSCTFIAQKYQNAQHRPKSLVTAFCLRVASDIPLLTGCWSTPLWGAKAPAVANIAHPQWCFPENPSPIKATNIRKERQRNAVLTEERKTRLELATPTLARLCSTNWAISA